MEVTSTTAAMEEQSPSTPEITLDPVQQEAVAQCCNITNRIVVVTGPAGCGKTTILKMAYNAMVEAGYRVVLCAPTGKAAKRIKEVTGIEASTIHRLLEYTHPGEPDPKTGKPVEFSYPRRTRSNPLEYDVVFADEYAMVAEEEHRNLIAALPNAGVLRAFGDDNQLAPIEEGKDWNAPPEPSSFQQLMKKFPTARLQTVYRQGKDSGILLNLHQILRGAMPAKNSQWSMQFTDQPVNALKDYVLEMQEEGIDFAGPENQIITVQNKSWVGTIKLNMVLQNLLQEGSTRFLMVPRNRWVEGVGGEKGAPIRMYVGDKVIATRNMYDLDIMNGETGKLIEITPDGELVIDFGDKERVVPPLLSVMNKYGKIVEVDPRKDIDLGYAITTHKSQGSEFKRVIYILNKSTMFMQRRRNFYTACSRGREHVHIITDQRSLSVSLSKRD